MRYWRLMLCGLGALVAGVVIGTISGNVTLGFIVAIVVAVAGSYLAWEFGVKVWTPDN